MPNFCRAVVEEGAQGRCTVQRCSEAFDFVQISNVKYICFNGEILRPVQTLSRLNQQVHSKLSSTEHDCVCYACRGLVRMLASPSEGWEAHKLAGLCPRK